MDNTYVEPLHPDQAWLEEVITDLTDWKSNISSYETTSQVTGCGAIREAETLFSSLHDNRPSLMVSSATAGMLIALKSIGVGAGSEVIIPSYDWSATLAALETLGAIPLVAPTEAYICKDGAGLLPLVSPNTKAVVISHVGTSIDVSAIRNALPSDVLVIEDCARVLGCKIKGQIAGTSGDMAIFSFGPCKKPIDIGEGGMIIARDWNMWERLVTCGSHPLRQMTAGVSEICPDALVLRPHPLAAVLLVVRLKRWMADIRNGDSQRDKQNIGCNNGTYNIASLLGSRRKQFISTTLE